jgi:hypothetical protein
MRWTDTFTALVVHHWSGSSEEAGGRGFGGSTGPTNASKPSRHNASLSSPKTSAWFCIVEMHFSKREFPPFIEFRAARSRILSSDFGGLLAKQVNDVAHVVLMPVIHGSPQQLLHDRLLLSKRRDLLTPMIQQILLMSGPQRVPGTWLNGLPI